MTAPGTQATPQATQSTAPMRSSSVGPGRPKEERCSKGVCLVVKAELRGVQALLKNAQTVLKRERSQRATLMAGEIRRMRRIVNSTCSAMSIRGHWRCADRHRGWCCS